MTDRHALQRLALAFIICVAMTAAAAAQTPPPDDGATAAQPPALPSFFVRTFSSVQWRATDEPDRPNSFTLGQLDLFVTATLSERVSVLAEVVLEASTTTRVVTDLERLQLTYRFNDYLNISAGRFHNGIGFYNTAFHHGSFFEIPIGRPRVFAFEDEGGVLPIHDIGLTVRGYVPHTNSSLRYLAEIGNGRSWDLTGSPADVDPGVDTNDAKAVNAGLAYVPNRWRGLEIGASFYRDTIPDVADTAVTHRIGAAYAVYRTADVELMAEWLTLWHRQDDGTAHTNHGGYAQASHAWGRWRPYYRFDRVSIDPATPFIGPTGSSTTHILGVRLDPLDSVGLKVQYERSNSKAGRGIDSIATELVFVF